MHRRLATSLFPFVLSLALGCEKKPDTTGNAPAPGPAAEPTSAATASPTASSSATNASAAGDAAAPVVTLLEPGAEPRRLLRFATKIGDRFTQAFDMKMKMSIAMAGMNAPNVDMPTLRVGVEGQIIAVTPDGDARIQAKLERIEALADGDPNAAAAMRQQLDVMRGLSMEMLMSSRGLVKEMKIDVPPNTPPQLAQMMDSMRQSMGQISAPFPVEAVGKGARWSVQSPIAMNGISLTQTGEYELVALTSNGGTAKVELRQSAEPQVMRLPGLPAGTEARLLSLSSRGTGELEFDLNQLTPKRFTSAITGDTAMSIEAAGQKQNMNIRVELALKFLPN